MSEIINNRFDFMALYEVADGNPNGDPDMGNAPRQDSDTGEGLVSDCCIKYKVRRYVELVKGDAPGYRIYYQSGDPLNAKNREAYNYLGITPKKASAKANKKDKKTQETPASGEADNAKTTITREEEAALTAFMCKNFYDVRALGAVMSTGVNCGQTKGPIQIGISRSVDMIYPYELSLTRCVVTREEESQTRTMGRKSMVPYGLYRVYGHVEAPTAKKTGLTEEDLELFWSALINMFENDHSAARGEMRVRKLIVFKHNSEFGCCHAHKLFEKVKIERLSTDTLPTSFEDYKVTIDRDMPAGVELIEMV